MKKAETQEQEFLEVCSSYDHDLLTGKKEMTLKDYGISLVEWIEDNRIKSLKEFGCNRNTYNPYQEGDTPQFKAEKANWF